MKTNTITNIETILETLQTSLESYKENVSNIDKDSNSYGSESEYSIKSLIGGVGNVITDVKFLVKAHNQFIQISTYEERRQIHDGLRTLNTSLTNKNHSQIARDLDALKLRMRPYAIRRDKDRVIEFLSEIDELRRKSIEFEELLSKVRGLLNDCQSVNDSFALKKQELEEEYETISQKKTDIETTTDEFIAKYNNFEELRQQAETNSQDVSTALKNAKDDLDEFNGFIEKIESRESELQKQSTLTQKYEEKLAAYTDEHNKLSNEASELIKKAKEALEYTTASGLSAAFQTEYNKANNRWTKAGWLTAALVFIGVTLLLGYWIVKSSTDSITDNYHMIFTLVGRFSMIPLTIYAAYYCASQYNKQNILSNDYAYKTTLAKSMVAFSEELKKDPEKYQEYITTVLKEIHQDPLRKREKGHEDSDQEATKLVNKVLDTVNAIIKKVPVGNSE